ncbi:PAS domain S-box protein [Tolypothrix sp. FACHB-123]|uniref:PAS domain S-box protein n=1 Tax=Tolypothrix sp. FACHB-123 TaxID=2692868 RepID=UPI001684FA73|nr:PAS domain S-box protein [Tolypothrix sp. FACHB-123]MBD2355592.1 PAS domain S-box protein [Tolypothrix sp. FACHB-123]
MSGETIEEINELQALLGKMQLTLGAIADAVVWVGAEQKVQWCNAAFANLLNRPNSDIIGSRFSDLIVLQKSGKAIALEAYPHIRLHAGDYETTNYEVKLKKQSFVWQISGICATSESDSTAVIIIRDITQSQRTAAALQESEAKFRLMVETANDSIGLIDASGKICYISPNIENMTGWNAAELTGQFFQPFIHPDDVDKCVQALNKAFTIGEKQSGIEYRFRKKDAGWQWQLANLSTLEDANGNLFVVGVGRDITERKRTEAALAVSESQYRDLVETANCIILRWDSAANIKFLNDYGQRFFGFELDEIIGQNVVGTIVPETETSGRDLQELMIDICQHPENYLFNENENICKNGQRRWIVWANKPILDAEGNLLEILSVGTDATARKQAQAELESSLSLLQATFESIHDGILAIDHQGNIVSYNSVFLEMWSIPPQILAEPEQSKRIAHLANQLKDPAGFLQKVKQLYATPEANSYDLLEFKDGRIFERYSCPQKLGDNILGRVWTFRDITAPKLAEEALKASEARLNAILSSALAAIYRIRVYTSNNWHFEYCSAGSIQLWGYSPEELIADKNLLLSRIVPEDLEVDITAGFNAIFAELPYESEYRYLHPDGCLRWISFSSTSVRHTETDSWVVTVIATDISNQKRTEAALRESEAKFRNIVENANEIICLVNSDHIISYASPNVLNITGYTPAEMEGKSYASFIHPEDLPKCVAAVQQVMATGERFSDLEHRSLYKDGSWQWQTANLALMQDAQGNLQIIGTVHNINEQKLAQAALQASEARLNTILNSTFASIERYRIYPNRDWVIEYCSPGCEKIRGYTAAEMMANSYLVASRILPEDLEPSLEQSFAAIFAERPHEGEYRYRHRDGSIRWLYYSQTSVRDAATDSWLVTLIITDITPRKQAEEALRLSEAKLRALYESLSVAIVLGNEQGIFDLNRAAEQLFGYSTAELLGKHVSLVSAPLQPNGKDAYSLANQNIATAFETGTHSFEWVHRRADGTDFPAEVSLTAVEVGEHKLVQAIVQDLSDRKQVEAALQERANLAAFRAEVGSALAQSDNLQVILNRCTAAVVKYLNAAFVQIWTVDESGNLLELQGTAGAVNPPEIANHPQIPVHELAIAHQRQPYFTNTILEDRRIIYRDWAVQKGMLSFAGYPLMLEEQLLGAWVMFAPLTFTEAALQALEFAANDIALGIKRKQAEAALRVSEERLRLSLEAGRMGIWDWNILTNDLAWSDNLEPLHGFAPGTFGGTFEAFLEIVHPQDREILTNAIANAVSSVSDYNTEFRIIWPDGSIRWMLGKGQAFRDATGRAVRMIGVGMDITSRKQAEEGLRRSEQKYRNIFENSLVGIGRSRLEDGLFLEINQPCAEIIGYSNVADLIGKRYAPEFQVNPDARAALFAEIEQHGEVRNYEIQLRRQDGELRWGLMSARPNLEESCLEFMIVDISDRKQAEQALKRRAQAQSLLSSISRQFLDRDLHTAINFTLQAIAQFIDSERCCIYAYSDNQAQCYLLYEWHQPGIESMANQASNLSISEFPEYHQQLLQGKVIQSTFTPENLNPIEREIVAATSVKSVVAVPMIHSEKVVGIVLANVVHASKTWSQEDVNLLKLVGEIIAMGRVRHQAEQALLFAKEAAEAANRAKSTFLANMSHELRTPLNAILGFAQLMERDTSLTDKQRQSLATINRSGEHLLNLINDVLDMSKIEAGRIVLHSEPLDLHQLLQTIQDMFQIRAKAKQLCLRFEIAANIPQYINTDEGKLRQVLINLLGNAVKFTQKGTVTLRTTAEMRRLDNQQQQGCILYFEIEDTGRGIAPEDMDKLFQPFVQSSSNQAIEGTGLGLAISRQFIRLMGGDINCSSSLGQGATFRFHLLVTLAEAWQQTPQFTTGKVIGLVGAQPIYRILVVDDAPNNQDIIVQLLSEVGFEVSCANNGQEAIALWQTWQPHVIFMDMRMPVMDGYTATREIRNQAQQQAKENQTIIIALTASAFEEEKSTILAAGCNDLIRKPFREQLIFDKLAEHLGVSYLYAENSNSPDTDAAPDYPTPAVSTLRASLKLMPETWIRELYQAANEVDGDRILQLIEQIPASQAILARELTNLNRRFCFDEIIELME